MIWIPFRVKQKMFTFSIWKDIKKNVSKWPGRKKNSSCLFVCLFFPQWLAISKCKTVILFPEVLIRNYIKCKQEETKNKKSCQISAECASKLPKSSRFFWFGQVTSVVKKIKDHFLWLVLEIFCKEYLQTLLCECYIT